MRVSLDLNFNESLTNDIVSFEQLGPGVQILRASIVFPIISDVKDGFIYIISAKPWQEEPVLRNRQTGKTRPRGYKTFSMLNSVWAWNLSC